MDKFYYHTGQTYTKGSQLQQFISNQAVFEYVPHIEIATNFEPGLYYDQFLLDLRCAFPGTLTLYRVPACTMYRWHRDERFKWAVNMVLDDFYTHSIFQTSYIAGVTNITELKYKPLEWAVFNTTEPHCVINLDTRDRVLATYRHYKAEYESAPDYSTVVDWVKSYAG